MNSLIKSLADEAKASVPHGLNPDKWIEVYNEKLVELTVRKCMTICEDVTDRNEPAIACYYAIKEQFGVSR